MVSGSSDGVVYPNMRRPSPAAYSMMFIARLTSPMASAMGLPSSRVIVRAISSERRSSRSSALNSTAALEGAGVSAQLPRAADAAATASRASPSVEDWNSPSAWLLLAGLVIV